jgi:uncharacterized protein (TIGR03067 family)
MKNLLIAVFVLALVIGLGCAKGMFGEKSIVGRWKEKRIYNMGSQRKWIEVDYGDDFLEFTAGGDWNAKLAKDNSNQGTYTLDNSVNPHRLILTLKKDQTQTVVIYKIEGDQLTIGGALDPKDPTPKDFEPDPKNQITEFIRK